MRKDTMPGISMIIVLEVYTNPSDLEITIGRKDDASKFAIGIFRGPKHSFKPLITSQPFAETLETAVESIKGILEMIQETASKELDPASGDVDQSKILNPAFIARILEELRANRTASTYMFSGG